MADLSALGNLQPIETLDLENYVDNRESGPSFRLAPKGRYQVRAPESFPSEAFGRTAKTKALSVSIDPTIIGPTNEGFTIRYTKVSATPFKRKENGKETTVSQIGDYLRAAGISGVLRTEQDLADAVEATANKVYEVELDWRAYSKKDGIEFKVEGMENFPKLEDGTYQSWVNHPRLKDEEDPTKPLKVRANLSIDRFIPAGQ
jgi:hypothetical protein